MLSFKQVTFSYPGDASPVVDGVSLDVAAGTCTVLLGANGSGKSTLAHLANGLLVPQSGQVVADGIDSGDPASLRALRQRVGLVSQDPDEQIVSTTVLDEVAFGPENLGLPPAEIALRVEQCLATVGLSGLEDRDPNTLSGGQKQRLVLAGILAMRPQYLVLDEPTSMLDAAARQEFTTTLAHLRQSGHGILHITHDLDLAADADVAAVLDQGRLVYLGPPEPLLADFDALVAYRLAVVDDRKGLEAEGQNVDKGVAAADGGLDGAAPVCDTSAAASAPDAPPADVPTTPCETSAAAPGSVVPSAATAPASALPPAATGSDAAAPGPAAPPVAAPTIPRDSSAAAPGLAAPPITQRSLPLQQSLQITDARFSYKSWQGAPVEVLQGLSLELQPGSYTLISGASGVGKSTLLRLAAGLLKPEGGAVGFASHEQADSASLDGSNAPPPNRASAAGGLLPISPGDVGLVFQHPEDQLFASTVAEDIAFGPRNTGLLAKGAADAEAELVAWALQSVGLEPSSFAGRSPFALSGGEMRRVAIAGILAMLPRFLLFDEPTAGLDALGRAFVHQLIDAQLALGTAVLVVSHSVEEFASRAQRHYRLQEGRLWPS